MGGERADTVEYGYVIKGKDRRRKRCKKGYSPWGSLQNRTVNCPASAPAEDEDTYCAAA